MYTKTGAFGFGCANTNRSEKSHAWYVLPLIFSSESHVNYCGRAAQKRCQSKAEQEKAPLRAAEEPDAKARRWAARPARRQCASRSASIASNSSRGWQTSPTIHRCRSLVSTNVRTDVVAISELFQLTITQRTICCEFGSFTQRTARSRMLA